MNSSSPLFLDPNTLETNLRMESTITYIRNMIHYQAQNYLDWLAQFFSNAVSLSVNLLFQRYPTQSSSLVASLLPSSFTSNSLASLSSLSSPPPVSRAISPPPPPLPDQLDSPNRTPPLPTNDLELWGKTDPPPPLPSTFSSSNLLSRNSGNSRTPTRSPPLQQEQHPSKTPPAKGKPLKSQHPPIVPPIPTGLPPAILSTPGPDIQDEFNPILQLIQEAFDFLIQLVRKSLPILSPTVYHITLFVVQRKGGKRESKREALISALLSEIFSGCLKGSKEKSYEGESEIFSGCLK
eukprot:CAMPEP_0201485498 /NCGR_PEP_ID=MMETSP0151_2-20130828/9594_1 /ASSEMBLY_ACC=CAM_ASM_000257 /TAXON_ID=200890 /ORGANISM="Paramoeba atlantica, Strain 621/1 / CCAP 1560/9" /LENGTH=293 /DNA_ID=CAMNT_0047869649 /DNA_START=216 /DNA_END=1094 /DNA_ORIENTATION=+